MARQSQTGFGARFKPRCSNDILGGNQWERHCKNVAKVNSHFGRSYLLAEVERDLLVIEHRRRSRRKDTTDLCKTCWHSVPSSNYPGFRWRFHPFPDRGEWKLRGHSTENRGRRAAISSRPLASTDCNPERRPIFFRTVCDATASKPAKLPQNILRTGILGGTGLCHRVKHPCGTWS